MSLNDKLLQGAAAAAGGLTPSEHFGVMLYEGDGSSSHSINGGKYGAAANFNGSSSTIVIPNSIEQPLIFAKEFGVSMWFNLASLPTGSDEDFLISLYQEGYLDIRIKANGVIQGKVAEETTGTDRIVTSANSVISANTWYHVVWTGETNNLILYVNGSSVATGSTWNGTYYHSNAGCRIGSKSGPSYYFNGKIDQTRIFQKYLSSSEVSTLYAETTSTVTSLDPLSEDTTDTLQVLGDTSCIALYKFENNEDDESGNYNGTGTTVQYAAGRYGQAASFNGTDSVVTGTAQNVGSSFSVSAWIYPASYGEHNFFNLWESSSDLFQIGLSDSTNEKLKIAAKSSNTWYVYTTTASPITSLNQWYHIVVNRSSSDLKIYVNGAFLESANNYYNKTYNTFNIGAGKSTSTNSFFDGKIDQLRVFNKTLSASEVTTLYNENSLVASYRFEGNSNDDTRNYDGTATNVTYEYGLGFKPDLVWIKPRSFADNHALADSTRGTGKVIVSNTNSAENNLGLASFDTGGFTLANPNWNNINSDGHDFVAWCWKANGGTTSSNTDGSVTSTVQANTDAGFSIIKYTGTSASSQSVGHNLSSAPEIVFIKSLSTTDGWIVWYPGAGTDKWLELNSNSGSQTGATWGGVPTSTVVHLQNGPSARSSGNGNNYIAYAFHSVDSFSKIGTYTGTGDADDRPIIETGFEPAFVMIKSVSTGGSDPYNWNIYDNKRNKTNPRNLILEADTSDIDLTASTTYIDFLSNGFQIGPATSGRVNGSGVTYIYMAFAADPDTEAPTVAKSFGVQAYTGINAAQSIDGLGFRPNLVWIKDRDTAGCYHRLIDDVKGLDQIIFSNATNAASTNATNITSFDSNGFTIGTADCVGGANTRDFIAWAWKANDNEPTLFGGPAKAVYKFEDNGNDVTGNNNATATSITYGTGKFNKGAIFNGTTSNFKTGSSFTGTNGGSFSLSCWVKIDNITGVENILLGRFSYTTSDKQFILRVNNGGTITLNVYNSSGTGESITTTDTLSIDTWYHIVAVVDGTKKSLYIDGQLSKSETGSISSNSSATGFLEIGGSGHLPASDSGRLDGMMDQVRIYNGAVSDIGVAALYAETVNDNDDLTLGGPPETIISANANAGFSIVKYTGTGGNTSVPHGLSATPELILIKNLDSATNWNGWTPVSGTSNYISLNLTAELKTTTGTSGFSNGAPTSTVVNLDGSVWSNESGSEHIMYCWHSVSGYSKIGSYSGDGTTTKTITTGFQPDFVLIKITDQADNWVILDSVRGGSKNIKPNSSVVEATESGTNVEFISTGFKLIGSGPGLGQTNGNGNSYIYAAFKIN